MLSKIYEVYSGIQDILNNTKNANIMAKRNSPKKFPEKRQVNLNIHQMELDVIDKKIRKLVTKLRKHNIHLEVFEPKNIVIHDQILGRGGEAIVQKATVVYNDIPIEAAVKTMLNNTEMTVSITLDEIELLCLSSDPIVNPTLQVYGVAAMPDDTDSEMGHLVIVMECGVMNALQLYQEEDVPLHVTYDLWSRLAAAVLCLHHKKIIHQDLKPENILVTSLIRDSIGQIEKIHFKIIDLGMAKRMMSEKIIPDDILGTNGYHPPEVLFEDSYDFKADVFMLGITFSVMLHSPAFLKSQSLQSLLMKLHQAKQRKMVGGKLYENVLEPTFRRYRDISVDVKNMICMMLEDQENREISLLGILNLCRLECDRVREQEGQLPPRLSPAPDGHSPHAGILKQRADANGQRHAAPVMHGGLPKHPHGVVIGLPKPNAVGVLKTVVPPKLIAVSNAKKSALGVPHKSAARPISVGLKTGLSGLKTGRSAFGKVLKAKPMSRSRPVPSKKKRVVAKSSKSSTPARSRSHSTSSSSASHAASCTACRVPVATATKTKQVALSSQTSADNKAAKKRRHSPDVSGPITAKKLRSSRFR